ncbi:MAG: hypothetical protein ACI4A7_06705 [Prevotella sp.]
MKKTFIIAIMAVFTASIAKATVLFPFFNDISADNKMIMSIDDKKFEQIMYKGSSSWGGIADCISFLDDVLPDDVSKNHVSPNMVVYTSLFRKHEIDTIEDDNKISAIYILKKGNLVEVFYTESNSVQQKAWQEDIASGKL